MRVGEAQAFAREPINIWSQHLRRAVTTHVAIAEIVRVDQDDVWPVSRGGGESKKRCEDRKNDEFHFRDWKEGDNLREGRSVTAPLLPAPAASGALSSATASRSSS